MPYKAIYLPEATWPIPLFRLGRGVGWVQSGARVKFTQKGYFEKVLIVIEISYLSFRVWETLSYGAIWIRKESFHFVLIPFGHLLFCISPAPLPPCPPSFSSLLLLLPFLLLMSEEQAGRKHQWAYTVRASAAAETRPGCVWAGGTESRDSCSCVTKG